MKIESFQVFELSQKAKVIIKEGSRTVTITKRLNPMQEIQLRINGDELAMLFHVLNMRTLTDEAIKAMTTENKGVDKNANTKE